LNWTKDLDCRRKE